MWCDSLKRQELEFDDPCGCLPAQDVLCFSDCSPLPSEALLDAVLRVQPFLLAHHVYCHLRPVGRGVDGIL